MTSTPHNPDGNDLLEFADAVNTGRNPQPQNDLERTYLHVHNTMQGESAAIPSDLKQSTWEDVMSTLALTPEAPVSNRTRRARTISTPTFTPRRLRWTPLASLAAAALVIIASFGVWQISTAPVETPPPTAPHVAGIVPTGDEVAQVASTPEATAVEDTSGSRSVPIVQQVDQQPFDGPVIWLTTDGDVMYDDGTDVTTIATGASSVLAQTGPNVIQITETIEGGDIDRDNQPIDTYVSTYYNLVTGETLVDDGSFSSFLGGPNTFDHLTVRTIADAPGEWSIVNFETMESRPISELTGGLFRSSESITVAVSDDHSTIAIGTSQYESEGSAILMRQSGLPGEVAVISSDLELIGWVAVPEDMPTVNNISLSPDGSKLALISNPFNLHGDPATTVTSIIDIQTGEEIHRTEPTSSVHGAFFQWIEDGTAVITVTESTILRHTFDGSPATTLFETDGSFMLMPQFGQSDLLHVLNTTSDVTTSTPEPAETQFLIINTATGETITLDGNPWFLGLSSPVQLSTPLAPVPVSQDSSTAVLVHPITGEEYPDLVADVYDPIQDIDFEAMAGEPVPLFFQPVLTARYADVSVVTLVDGSLAIFHTTEDSFEARVIEVPVEVAEKPLYLSPDGQYLVAGSNWNLGEGETMWLLDLSDENAEWVQGEPDVRVDFVEVSKD